MRVKGLDISVTARDQISIYGSWTGNPGELHALIRVLADTANSVDLIRRKRLKKKLAEKLSMGKAAQQDISKAKSSGTSTTYASRAASPLQKEKKDG